MKKKIRLISVLLALVMLFATAYTVVGVAYEMNISTESGAVYTLYSIDSVDITLKAPAAGAVSTSTDAKGIITLAGGSHCTVEFSAWFHEDGTWAEEGQLETYTFQAGETYKLLMTLMADEGYFFPDAEMLNVTVSGGKLESIEDTYTYTDDQGSYSAAVIIASVTIGNEPETCTVKFDANGGSGTMKDITVNKGEQYALPECTFTAPDGKEFDKWDKGAVGTKITVSADVTVKAQWKDKAAGQQQQEDPPAGQQPPQEEQPQTETQQEQQEQQSDEQVTYSKLKSVKLKAVSKKKIKVSWKKLSKKVRKEVKMIQIQVSTDPEFKTILKEKCVSSKKKSYTIGGLKKNTQYYVRVRAYTEKDGDKHVSEWVTKNKKTKKK